MVPLLGHRLIVTGGPAGEESLDIGLAPVVVIALFASLGGWAVLALLERLLPRIARRIRMIIALAILLMSFAPLLAPGKDTATRLSLGALHVAVAAVLIPAMTRTTAPDRPPHRWRQHLTSP